METVKNIILVSNDLVRVSKEKSAVKMLLFPNFLIFVARLLLLSHS